MTFKNKKNAISVSIWLLVNMVAGLLQLLFGAFQIEILAFPNHLLLIGLIVATSFVFAMLLETRIGNFLASYPVAITSIIGIAFWSIILGLTTQYSQNTYVHDVVGYLGIRQMTSFYPFVLSYCYLIICLTFTIAKRLKQGFSMRNVGFIINHVGLLLTLYFIGGGAADTKQYTMSVNEGKTEWRAIDSKTKEIQELPIAIQLDDFIMEEYNPKLAIIHRVTGKVQPEKLPQFFDIDTVRRIGKLIDWEIEVKEFIKNAIRVNDSTYQQISMPGVCPAAYIEASNKKTGDKVESWVSSGNNMQLYKYVEIGAKEDSLIIAMTQAEPKAYYSDISVFLKSGISIKESRVEVNKPLAADRWMIYQSDYDKALGTMSMTSVFDLVFDPWRIHIMASMILLMIGCLFLFWRVDNKKKIKK